MEDMSNIKTVQNGGNTTTADDKIFGFVYNYARNMGMLEEIEHNLSMLNQPYATFGGRQSLASVRWLNGCYEVVEELYEEIDEFAQSYYKDNMEIYHKRTLVLISLIDKWEKSSSVLNLGK